MQEVDVASAGLAGCCEQAVAHIAQTQTTALHRSGAGVMPSAPPAATMGGLLLGTAGVAVTKVYVSAPFPSFLGPVLTENYLYHACSCEAMLRLEMARQVAELSDSWSDSDLRNVFGRAFASLSTAPELVVR
eukprot:COSAG01_NODE_2571_length_7440_cov_27.241384_4_plen_132_part_00